MNLCRKKISDYLKKCGFRSYGYSFFAVLLLAFVMAACSDEDPTSPEPEPEPTSTFKLHIGEGNVTEVDLGAPAYYPPMQTVTLVMEDLPADEKIIYMGGVCSAENPEPDLSDYALIYDYSDDETFQNWDWEKEPLYWLCEHLLHPLPGKTYYVRGYVRTDKAEYYSNTIELRSRFTDPVVENSGAYEIPVVFHLFPDAEGNYPFKDWMVREQLDYANLVYGNYYRIPGQTETSVRFVAATHAPDGTPLNTPGIVHEKEAVEVDLQNLYMDARYVWDMEHALNVWVCPVKNSNVAGFTDFPFFDESEVLEGCHTLHDPDVFTGIFLNVNGLLMGNTGYVFAHEAGHFLGLAHVFSDDFCDDTPWYDYYAYWEETQGDIYCERRDETGKKFWSDNIMDYDYGFMTGFTPDQVKRIQYTLRHAYFIPGEAGKEAPAARSVGQSHRFGVNPVW